MISLFNVHMREGVEGPLKEVLYSGYIGQGKKVEEFESLLKDKFLNPYTLTVNSCTSGLHLLLHALGEKGCEVLTSPLTCTATNWPVLANGMRPKWVDVGRDCNMDVNDLRMKLSPTTKVILLTHWGGLPIDLALVRVAQIECQQMYGFTPIVIQDCAHAMGSKYQEEPLSMWFNCAYSFQAIKHFTTVDGGAVTVLDRDIYKRLKLLRWYGIDRDGERKDFRCETDIAEWGFKFHMNDVNATIGIHNFPLIDEVVKVHHGNSQWYDEALNFYGLGSLNIEKGPDVYSAQWIHTIHVERRDDFMRYMKENGVMTSRVHERNDIHSCVKEFKTDLPSLDEVSKTMICIPNGVTVDEREYIADLIKAGW